MLLRYSLLECSKTHFYASTRFNAERWRMKKGWTSKWATEAGGEWEKKVTAQWKMWVIISRYFYTYQDVLWILIKIRSPRTRIELLFRDDGCNGNLLDILRFLCWIVQLYLNITSRCNENKADSVDNQWLSWTSPGQSNSWKINFMAASDDVAEAHNV